MKEKDGRHVPTSELCRDEFVKKLVECRMKDFDLVKTVAPREFNL